MEILSSIFVHASLAYLMLSCMKEGIFRKLVKDAEFEKMMITVEKHAWNGFNNVVSMFSGNTKNLVFWFNSYKVNKTLENVLKWFSFILSDFCFLLISVQTLDTSSKSGKCDVVHIIWIPFSISFKAIKTNINRKKNVSKNYFANL